MTSATAHSRLLTATRSGHGTIDSFSGTLTRTSDGFTIHFDIGGMSGTRIARGNQEKFALFRVHTINEKFAYTGIERFNGKQTIATTVCDWCERSHRLLQERSLARGTTPDMSARQAQLSRERPDPANFYADVTRDEDLVDFMLIVNSYKAKVIPAPPPLIGDVPRAPDGPFTYGEAVDGIALGIRVDTTEYRLNHCIHVWITLRNTSGRTLMRNDSLFRNGQLYISTPGGWAGASSTNPWGPQGLNSPVEVGMSLHSLMGRESTGTFLVQWMLGGPKPGPTRLGSRAPWKLESGVVTFTVSR